MSVYWLDRVRLLGSDRLQQVQLTNGKVTAIGTDLIPPDCSEVLDFGGDYLSLGGVDLQINGALGIPFPWLKTTEPLPKIGRYLWQEGIDAYAPTIVTAPLAEIHTALKVLHEYAPNAQESEAKILGVHLEGPFLNPQKRGAHPQQYLQPLTFEAVKQVLAEFSRSVCILTLAPELDATNQVLAYLRGLGITVSLGHSLATVEEAQAAFDAGATMITHAFNAMPPLHHREPGLLAAALTDQRVWCGVIGDGVHVHPQMLKVLWQCAGDRLFLVSDALAPLGLGDGVYPWDQRQIAVKNGTARLADGTLCGTTVPLLAMVGRLVDWGVCDFEAALTLATVNPRRAIGLTTELLQQPVTHLLRWRSPHHYERLPSELHPPLLSHD
ncbi:N-acetylglucosamine-6-phosphate deacetylase [Thermosynechococcus sp. B0]|uniref:N-acetylglucosamine-6-phosphate deacetylase n=1 Tax=unclassified Thermosynechococcus TaxID=2622553 RepID=UPI0025765FF9|nr:MULTISPECIES: N-acetylglucosamine-6-phosphate deacetylase [unclassified Thermosynechococcus]WJI25110.1 N-acetylglucosamine-6-phosphate deacetylase [Thermosynechococcus sp. B0]WJI30171.1 N-acetylglucosamine-6-phosphate deacetylase [Thermosynechococcus sp. B3]